MTLEEAKFALDKVIKKGRVHLYKPIQVAEILHRDRINGDINLSELGTYRTRSRKWRDTLCITFLGRTSTSSARYQDDLFNENAVPPEAFVALGEYNRMNNGVVEAYIYWKFSERFQQMTGALDYVRGVNHFDFELPHFLELFWNEPGLRRSIDKVFEIVVYALFSVLVEELGVVINVRYNQDQKELLEEFEDFANRVIQIDTTRIESESPAKVYRVGVTNAADRGLDMWANFGPAIQIKHLQLTERLAEDIVGSVTAERIVIVCKDSEKSLAESIFNQIGWGTKVQSIITEGDLINWYERALRGRFSEVLGPKIIDVIGSEIIAEFPSSDQGEFEDFFNGRGYNELEDEIWNPSLGPSMAVDGDEEE